MMSYRLLSAVLRALRLAIPALVVVWSVLGIAPSLAQTCGNDLQVPCIVEKVRAPCYSCMGGACSGCYYYAQQCNDPSAYLNDQGVCFTAPNYSIPAPSQVSFTDKGKPVTDGYYVKIDLTQAWIVIPNLKQPATCTSNSAFPNATAVIGPDPNDPAMPTWAASSEYRVRLAINASFFEIKAPKSDPNNWHSWVCTNVFGYTLSNKVLVRREEQLTVYQGGAPAIQVSPGTLVFYTSQGARDKGREAEIKQYPMFPGDPTKVPAEFQNAISGPPLLTNGTYVGDAAAQPEATCRLPRTAAGLSADGNTLILVVVNPGDDNFPCDDSVNGTTLASLAGYIKSLGAQDAINLDGGGSSQLYYKSPSGRIIQTKPSDYISRVDPRLYYRPVGNMLGIR